MLKTWHYIAILAVGAGLVYYFFIHKKHAMHPAVAAKKSGGGGGGWRHRLSHVASGMAHSALASSGIPGASTIGSIAGI